ncbi:hypothetical protein BDR26DRAFT_857450 [Obelidium mucronatum]|nr:hypothetical protein BDR26DRAFT_878033 [Obelidium mucronatum]KAI9344242.1 hypothetical protein BDR26DRAFT_857450 [Obelidium mucronatum]
MKLMELAVAALLFATGSVASVGGVRISYVSAAFQYSCPAGTRRKLMVPGIPTPFTGCDFADCTMPSAIPKGWTACGTNRHNNVSSTACQCGLKVVETPVLPAN